MELYTIVWQERDNEPDFMHVVAKNLTEERARKYVSKYLLDEWDTTNPNYEYFWYTPVQEAVGIGTKNTYSIEVKKK